MFSFLRTILTVAITLPLLAAPLKAQASLPSRMLARSLGLGSMCRPEPAALGATAPGHEVMGIDFGEVNAESRNAYLLLDDTRTVKRVLLMWAPLSLRDSSLIAYSVFAMYQPDGSPVAALQEAPMLRSGVQVRPDSSRPPVTAPLSIQQSDSIFAFATWLLQTACPPRSTPDTP